MSKKDVREFKASLARAGSVTLTAAERQKYSDAQPRDDHGRWAVNSEGSPADEERATTQALSQAGITATGRPSSVARADYTRAKDAEGTPRRTVFAARDAAGRVSSVLEIRHLTSQEPSLVETTWRWTRPDMRGQGVAARLQQVAEQAGFDMRTSAEYATQSETARAFNEAYFAGRAHPADLPLESE